jgi:hemolysin III
MASRDGLTQGRPPEEVANAITHGIGVVLSLAGGAALIVWAVLAGGAWELLGVSIFVAALVLLYSASTCYHLVRAELAKRRLRLLDHCAIYVLIAGTYTPFTLAMRGAWGWTMFGVAWALAAAGVVFKLLLIDRFPRVSTAIYLAMGWMILIAAGPMIRHLDTATLAWLAAGGITYTAGTVFYHARRIPFAHAVWHVFVIGGSVCHGIAVATHL